jgi:hypothetical protein
MFLTHNKTVSDSLCTVRHALSSLPAEFDSIADLENRRLERRTGYSGDSWASARASAERIPLETLFEAYNQFVTVDLPSPTLSDAVWEVVLAIHAREYLEPEQYGLLVGPWEAEFGPIDTQAPQAQARTRSMGRRF